MNEFDIQISPSLKRTVHEFIERERIKRETRQSIINHETSIRWIKEQFTANKLSQANIAEYNHQIRYHEINLAFLNDDMS